MKKDNNAASRLHLICQLGAVGSSFTCLASLLTGASLTITLTSGLWAVPMTFLSRHYKREYGVTVTETFSALGAVMEDLDAAVNDVNIDPTTRILRRLLPKPDLNLPTQKNTSWIDNQFWNSNTAYIGMPGTHKSVNLKHHTDQVVKRHGIDSLFAICDIHYDHTEEELIDTWLPGVPRDELPVYKDTEDAFKALVKFYEEYKRRVKLDLKSLPSLFFVIDEFQDTISSIRMANALQIISEIVRGGRKFGMRFLIGTHSPKKGENGLDSSVFWSMTICVMGLTIADTTVQWPGDMKKASLLNELETALAVDEKSRYTTAVVRPGSYAQLPFASAKVKQLEDRSEYLEEFVFDSVPWIDQVRPKVEQAIEEGRAKSFTAICRLVNLDGAMQKDRKTGLYKDDRVQLLHTTFGGLING